MEKMLSRILPCWITAAFLILTQPAIGANYTIDNPADRIDNPASRIYNPAGKIHNPAAEINKPDPVSSSTSPKNGTRSRRLENTEGPQLDEVQAPPVVPQKRYNFKKVRDYLNAAKKAFVMDDYIEFLSVTEDALRRISAGTLKASDKTRRKLEKFRTLGYGLIEPDKGSKPVQ